VGKSGSSWTVAFMGLGRRLDSVEVFAIGTPSEADRELPTPRPDCSKDGQGEQGAWSGVIFAGEGGGTGEGDKDGGKDSCRGGDFERRGTDGSVDTGDSSKGRKLKRGTGRV